jgi:hypothetical protein
MRYAELIEEFRNFVLEFKIRVTQPEIHSRRFAIEAALAQKKDTD